MSEEMKSEIVTFLKTCVHPDGGYGGGPGQLGHLATTYAAVLCLISIGTEQALASIDRELTYKFLLARHQPSGAYTMHHGGEEDIRAPYLALVSASLLKIIDSKLTDMVAEWIMSCQTYEGGFGGEPGMEAHGGYTFCAFACLCLLDKAKILDVNAVLKWLVRRQMKFEGGFQGRTNKHVDGCYSFWQGAVFRLIDTELEREEWFLWMEHSILEHSKNTF
ncbi:hypothetical protein PFISCL1PPCAC_28746 [Pristionchus fissidentatus]|uniref:Prenyltransferase alpha-alpha toroid domain-containing protein n=1 Tax=Pristionchus fissidentatus TaxID=1538716 RepID=A0AAV5X4Z0_9BILA|nr:hypothetical protein PFISCL1PPCAC_28746 [Pristionchus fissidentatus]